MCTKNNIPIVNHLFSLLYKRDKDISIHSLEQVGTTSAIIEELNKNFLANN